MSEQWRWTCSGRQRGGFASTSEARRDHNREHGPVRCVPIVESEVSEILGPESFGGEDYPMQCSGTGYCAKHAIDHGSPSLSEPTLALATMGVTDAATYEIEQATIRLRTMVERAERRVELMRKQWQKSNDAGRAVIAKRDGQIADLEARIADMAKAYDSMTDKLVATEERAEQPTDAQPFSVEEARESARNHARQAAGIRSQMLADADDDAGESDYNERFATDHERTAATLRKYVEQEGRIAELEKAANVARIGFDFNEGCVEQTHNRAETGRIASLEGRLATVKVEAEALETLLFRGHGAEALLLTLRAIPVILAACDGIGAVGVEPCVNGCGRPQRLGRVCCLNCTASGHHNPNCEARPDGKEEAAELRRKLARAVEELTGLRNQIANARPRLAGNHYIRTVQFGEDELSRINATLTDIGEGAAPHTTTPPPTLFAVAREGLIRAQRQLRDGHSLDALATVEETLRALAHMGGGGK